MNIRFSTHYLLNYILVHFFDLLKLILYVYFEKNQNTFFKSIKRTSLIIFQISISLQLKSSIWKKLKSIYLIPISFRLMISFNLLVQNRNIYFMWFKSISGIFSFHNLILKSNITCIQKMKIDNFNKIWLKIVAIFMFYVIFK